MDTSCDRGQQQQDGASTRAHGNGGASGQPATADKREVLQHCPTLVSWLATWQSASGERATLLAAEDGTGWSYCNPDQSLAPSRAARAVIASEVHVRKGK